MLSLIAAIAEDNALGKDGQLLCHLPNDLKHFKEITTGAPVIMGSRTYISLPRRPLPNRRNIVLTSRDQMLFEGAETARTVADALQRTADAPEVFIIGGGQIFEQTISMADRLHITHIHHHFEGADTFFPPIDPAEWQCTDREDHPADDRHPYPYTFATYIRKRNSK